MPEQPTSFYNEEEIKKNKIAQEKYAQEQARDLSDLKKLLQMPEFRRYVWRELERCGVFSESFNTNAMIMARNEGTRSVGISLLAELMLAKHDAFAKMQAEFYSETKSKEKQTNAE
jgi:hypothetical protein